MIKSLHKILVVENEGLLLQAMERAFENRSLDLSTATTVQQAYDFIADDEFDLFILEYDPYDSCRKKLLEYIDRHCPFVPIILLTTHDSASEHLNSTIRQFRKHGSWHLIEKPFHLSTMFSFITSISHSHGKGTLGPFTTAVAPKTEKRLNERRAQIQSIKFNLTDNRAAPPQHCYHTGIVTDISTYGIGILTSAVLKQDQVLSFDNPQKYHFGSVRWCRLIDTETYRAGIELY